MSTEVGVLLAHGSNFVRMPFLPAPAIHRHQWELNGEPRFDGCKYVDLTTEPRPLPKL